MWLYFSKPKIMVFFTSFRCNLHCLMCYGWIKQKYTKELSIDEIEYIFSDRLLRDNLEIINITGGEPTLRSDLTEIVRIIVKNCRHLRRIDISTNGVNTLQIIDQMESILAILLLTNIKLTVSISVDGIEKLHEQIRGTPNIFADIDQTIGQLKELMIHYPFLSLGLNMTISKLNYYAIEQMQRYALQKNLGINFTLAAISDIGVESTQMREKFEMNQEQKNKVARSIKALSQNGAIDPRYGRFMQTWLVSGRRNGSCAFKQGKAFLIEPNGETYICGNYKEFRIGNITEEPFAKMWRRAANKLKSLPVQCLNCLSNCYMDGAK